MSTTSDTYDAEAIEVLEGLEAVRKRPGMYIGGTGSPGLQHLLWEILDNAVDEAASGHANRIEVAFQKDGSVEVTDNGRGIPIDIKDGEVSALEVVFTELHAGGKFGTKAYATSGGLHGVGASVVNALSAKMVVDVNRKSATHRLGFRDQVAGQFAANGRFTPGHKLKKVGRVANTKTGTRVQFWPDNEIFDSEALISYDEVRDRIAQVCFLVPGLKVKLVDRRPGGRHETEEFVSKGGLTDFVDHLSEGEAVCPVVRLTGHDTFEERVPVEGRMKTVNRECHVDVAMRWVSGFDTKIVSFVNTIPTTDGGTHVAGFERAMTRTVNDVLLEDHRKLKRAKGDARAQRDDVQEGLIAVLRVTVPEPQFKGQTKQELGTPAIQTIAYNVVKQGFTDWAQGGGRKTHIRAVTDKLAEAVLTRIIQRAALETRRKAAQLGSAGMPEKLADCRTHPGGELILVEGDSAAGPAKAGRSSDWQAVLPLRGKVVNAGKSNRQAVLDNAEAAALFTAIGAGSGDDFRLGDARYERIVLLTDADVDGSHIRCLLLTLLYHYMRPLLEAGRVYAAVPPTHSVKLGKKNRYVFSESEKDELVAELREAGGKPSVLRFKGLGEMDVDELATFTLDPATRVLRRVTVDDAKAAEKIFETLMGPAVEPRRDFIVKHSRDYGHALDV